VGYLFRIQELIIKPIFKLKLLTMKRFLTIIALAGTLAACNNSADSTADQKDSLDSLANEKKEMIDSTADQRKDVIDSTTEQKKDVLDRVDSATNKQ
jgi:hypothetical protein